MTSKEFMAQSQDAEYIRKTWPELQKSTVSELNSHLTARVVDLAASFKCRKPNSPFTLLTIRRGSTTVEFNSTNPVEDISALFMLLEDEP